MNVIKVLMVTVTFGEGSGVNSFIMNYFRSIDHTKVHIDVLAYKESPTGKSPYEKEIEAAGGSVFLLPGVKQFPKHIKEIKRILREGNYDIVHDNSLIMTIPLMRICKKEHIKVRILHSHATKLGETPSKEFRNSVLLPLLTRSCNYRCACSDAAGKAMFGEERFCVLPNVIDHERYLLNRESREANRKSHAVSDCIVIVSVGRASQQKNPVFALQVIRQLKEKYPNLAYWWVGDGPLMPLMKETAKELGIDDITTFWGKQSNVRDFYEMADIFFLPSFFEGLPLTGVESQAMGLPSVVSDAVTKEMVYTDLVEYVSLQDPLEQWVAAFEKQIRRIPERRSCTAELRQSCFSIEGAGARLEKAYQEMLEKAR